MTDLPGSPFPLFAPPTGFPPGLTFYPEPWRHGSRKWILYWEGTTPPWIWRTRSDGPDGLIVVAAQKVVLPAHAWTESRPQVGKLRPTGWIAFHGVLFWSDLGEHTVLGVLERTDL